MSGIHQFVPMLHRRDAVGRHALRLRDLLVAQGIDSRIFVEILDPETASECEPASAYEARREPGDVLVYQLATASALAGWLSSRSETLVVNYHNITPPEFFAPWDNPLARNQVQARHELQMLAPRTALAVAVSSYNERELHEVGYRNTTVIPPAALLPEPAEPFPRTPAPSTPPPEGARWLTVGRLAPNKVLEHALMALLVTRTHYDRGTTLDIIGKTVVPAYSGALRRFSADLGLHDAVTFAGRMDDDAVEHAMASSDVMVVTSEHEGFGVTVIEALRRGLPVVANRAGALPEVLGEAGVLVNAAEPYEVAAAVADLLADPKRQGSLAEAGRVRISRLGLDTAGERFVDQVRALL